MVQSIYQKLQSEHVKIARRPSLRLISLKSEFYGSLKFLKIAKISREKVAGEQMLLTNNICHTNPLNFPKRKLLR